MRLETLVSKKSNKFNAVRNGKEIARGTFDKVLLHALARGVALCYNERRLYQWHDGVTWLGCDTINNLSKLRLTLAKRYVKIAVIEGEPNGNETEENV